MNSSILETISSPNSIKNLSPKEITQLSTEIRKKIIEVVGSNGGHLASNLGVVELTIALHRVFDSPKDSFIWDVGHQCYTHKMLTGRYEKFNTIRKKDGISGFPKKEESVHDVFDTGHSSTSISAAYGLLCAKTLQKNEGKVVAIIGDGALTGGMALEALSHAGQDTKGLIVILNDNKMSISPNIGALSEYLSKLSMGSSYQKLKYKLNMTFEKIPIMGPLFNAAINRIKRGIKGILFKENLFVDLGFEYVGPLNGHDVSELEKVLRDVKKINKPVVVHVLTCKGKGYSLAENDPSTFHGIGPFCISDGTVEKFDTTSFTEAFSHAMLAQAAKRSNVVAITAAMAKGTGLAAFQHRYPDRFFDVGIAEQHALTFAAGLATGLMHPVVAIYSTFMQRAVDQFIHDVALQGLPLVLALDRAGPVPDDGETHQGLFDISLLRSIPNISILTPSSAQEVSLMLDWALDQNTPVVLRYPKGACPTEQDSFSLPIEKGCGIFTHKEDSDTLIVCTGGMYPEVHEAGNILARAGNHVDTYVLRFVKPIDESNFLKICQSYQSIVFVEDGIQTGGIAQALSLLLHVRNPKVRTCVLAFAELFYPQGTRKEILSYAGLSPNHIVDAVNTMRTSFSSSEFEGSVNTSFGTASLL